MRWFMNLRERLQIRALINLIISVIERLAALFDKYGPSKPKPPSKPNRPRPLKKVIDSIDKVIPLPWRK
jgi:hypothetical protein